MLIVPNSIDTTGGNKYEALDQAEPDSLDFEIAGNSGRSGVVTGCEVTTNNSASNVAVASGVIYLNGTSYTTPAAPSLALPSAPSDNRFDLVVARVSSGVASLVVVSGPDDPTNPTFPRSVSVATGAPSPSTTVNLDTDVVLGVLYRSGNSTVTGSRIVDKRVMQSSGLALQGTDVPNSGVGTGPGNLYFKNNVTVGDASSSGVYVKLNSGAWVELGRNTDGPIVPIGGGLLWPTSATVPANYVEPTGQSMSTSTYSALFAIYGYEHGGSGGTFLMPDYNGFSLRITSNSALVGTSVGTDTTTLTTANLPSHSHGMAHTHSFTHTHPLDHDHASFNSGNGGGHTHGPGTLAVVGQGGRNPMLREPTYGSTIYATGHYTNGTGNVDVVHLTNNPTFLYYGGGMAVSQVGQLVVSGNVASASAHQHPVDVPAFTGTTASQSNNTTAGQSPTSTDPVGSGTSFSRVPLTKYSRMIVRVA